MVGAMNDAFFAKARRNMVDSQILPNRVTDERVIAAFEELLENCFCQRLAQVSLTPMRAF